MDGKFTAAHRDRRPRNQEDGRENKFYKYDFLDPFICAIRLAKKIFYLIT